MRWLTFTVFFQAIISCLALQLAIVVPQANRLSRTERQRVAALSLALADYPLANVDLTFIQLSESSLENVDSVQSYIAATHSVTTATMFISTVRDESILTELFLEVNVCISLLP